ncbi:organic solvent tolerance protein OstA [Gloeocapsopsis crepidinum LEGE 06123]|uniref:Organic solvent tolerance protein OstA n=1 Tax=Gloeocapsopsis crepidinum LEGE 06123 TaxID=588587 RepID=A0ABR9ULK2_9CHRO|nr:LptA/OstA family protein [Gloeocapsopsis crepidinum]MBE9189169.1 organic solvent tolerance protein OstA [Gloeocapsopsis crepidinum LEGE 06123]
MMPHLPSFLTRHRLAIALLPFTLLSAIALNSPLPSARGQTADQNSLIINSDVQEANSQTGIFTARGNVQMNYPARQIQATAAQAQYFSQERRIILSGDVYILQQGNSIRGENVTYLIDEGRFIATPKANQQVQSIYIVSDPNPNQLPGTPSAPPVPPLAPSPGS